MFLCQHTEKFDLCLSGAKDFQRYCPHATDPVYPFYSLANLKTQKLKVSTERGREKEGERGERDWGHKGKRIV
jgi:hypothetical protein